MSVGWQRTGDTCVHQVGMRLSRQAGLGMSVHCAGSRTDAFLCFIASRTVGLSTASGPFVNNQKTVCKGNQAS